MRTRPTALRGLEEIASMLIATGVLLACIYYARAAVDLGFSLDRAWRVATVYGVPEGVEAPAPGDRILRIGPLRHEDWLAARTSTFGDALRAPEVEIELLRAGRSHVIRYPLARAQRRFGGRLFWLLPLNFWLAGAITAAFCRPRDGRRRLLVLVWLATALWLAAGASSFYRVGYASLVFSASMWAAIPLLLQLHLLLPTPIGTRSARRGVAAAVWLMALGFFVAGRALPRGTVLVFFAAAILISLGLCLWRLWRSRQPAERAATRLMLTGFGLGMSPILVYALLTFVAPRMAQALLEAQVFLVCFVLLLPIWPLTYFYALYRHRLGTVGLRANRVVGNYGFAALAAASLMLVAMLAGRVEGAAEPALPVAVAAAALFALFAAPLHRGFLTLIDRHVFGIRYSPEDALANLSQEIPEILDRTSLARIIDDDLLPMLMVRQSALVLFDPERGGVFHSLGLSDAQRAHLEGSPRQRQALVSASYDAPGDDHAWVRLAIPVKTRDLTLGIWLFGRRDPDDFYPKGDVALLSALASQVATVVHNLWLLESLERSSSEVENRNRELERFSYTVSHDLKAPLVTIKGFLGLLRRSREQRDDKGFDHALDRIDSATEAMRRMLDDLLDLAQKGQKLKEREPVVLRDEVRRAALGVEGQIHQCGARLEIAEDLPVVSGDPTRVFEVFLNLLDNAAKFSAGSEDPRIEVTWRRDGDERVFVVRDNGPGISERDRRHVFGLFNRLDPTIEGSGIGLSLARSIITAHGGRIWIEDSGWGRGSAFCFTLEPPAEPAG